MGLDRAGWGWIGLDGARWGLMGIGWMVRKNKKGDYDKE